MSESFLGLSFSERREILELAARKLNRHPAILEKDIWLCWTLGHLFSLQTSIPMVFKGGTSLSKVYGVIQRFSEDIDITLDFRELGGEPNPYRLSRTKLAALNDRLKLALKQHVTEVIAPALSVRLANELPEPGGEVEVLESGEEIRIHYPSALATPAGYLGSSILVEFGGRNVTEPNESHTLTSEIAQVIPELSFPEATVSVLSPIRTFWEKATLIHVACQSESVKATVARQFRHWYDLAILADHSIGQQALQERHVLEDVVRHKKAFFHSSRANYDACLSGQMRLAPGANMLTELAKDYAAMIEAGMFLGAVPNLGALMERLRELERAVNQGS